MGFLKVFKRFEMCRAGIDLATIDCPDFDGSVINPKIAPNYIFLHKYYNERKKAYPSAKKLLYGIDDDPLPNVFDVDETAKKRFKIITEGRSQ